MSLITLTTDFGTQDWFVGTMKAVIAGLDPNAKVIDFTHAIPPGDLRAAAFALAASYGFSPKGTIHLVVVDPGVGSQRKAIAIQTANYVFVGPDNGVLSWALAKERIEAIHLLENPAFFLPSVSRTFHGRDIFAPVAAHLGRGVSISQLGPKQESLVTLPWPQPVTARGFARGEVIYVDQFGNAITNLDVPTLDSLGQGELKVFLGSKPVCPVAAFYQAVPPGRPVAVVGSSGFLELAINAGNAARKLKLRPGTVVTVRAD